MARHTLGLLPERLDGCNGVCERLLFLDEPENMEGELMVLKLEQYQHKRISLCHNLVALPSIGLQ